MINIKTAKEIKKMRRVCKLAAECLNHLEQLVIPGAIPLHIDQECADWTKAQGATCAPLNYHGFPNSCCISVNDVVCHGIPSAVPLKEGDIVNIDVSPKLNGFHGDTSKTFIVGEVPAEVHELVEIARESMYAGIDVIKDGQDLHAIGRNIARHVPEGYGLVKEFGGHGIGTKFHEEPYVPHFYIADISKVTLKEGMIITVEPMVNMGQRFTVKEADGWTIKTRDGSLSAQFEHTVLVTKDGFEILTEV